MDWITENIAIGNFLDARSLRESDVNAVLCLIENCCNEKNRNFDVLTVPLLDSTGNNLKTLQEAFHFIDDVVRNNERVLVHCHAGRSRSVCVVAKYLMIQKGLATTTVLDFIASKREIYLSPGIEEILDVPSIYLKR